MWLQIETFRRIGTGPWIDMLEAVAQDPAMLIWLDQAQSRKEHPNENFARESMELFVLGEGHYTEKDVTEAARAMTGWSLDRMDDQYRYRPAMHDTGMKTVLGVTGPLTGRRVSWSHGGPTASGPFHYREALEVLCLGRSQPGIDGRLGG